MKCVSVDLGWKNFAVCSMEVTPTSIKVYKWEIINLLKKNDVNDIDDVSKIININTASVEELIFLVSPNLIQIIKEWAEFNPDVVYLEAQPLGIMSRNLKTKTLSHVFQALLTMNGIKVQFVNPKKKLKGMVKSSDNNYSDNKKFAIAETEKLLNDFSELIEWKSFFQTKKGKLDDLADAFLQGYYSALDVFAADGDNNNSITKKKLGSKKKRSKRAKISSHAITENILNETEGTNLS